MLGKLQKEKLVTLKHFLGTHFHVPLPMKLSSTSKKNFLISNPKFLKLKNSLKFFLKNSVLLNLHNSHVLFEAEDLCMGFGFIHRTMNLVQNLWKNFI